MGVVEFTRAKFEEWTSDHFRKLDKNNDLLLEFNEVHDFIVGALKENYPNKQFTELDVAKVFLQIDKNGDEKIDYHEFSSWLELYLKEHGIFV